jgi:hypothetical protein
MGLATPPDTFYLKLQALEKELTVGIQKTIKTWSSLTAATTALLVSAAADAALFNGADGSYNTSVFISVVERTRTNQIIRNLVVDTGSRALDVFAGTPWSTTSAQEEQIRAFVQGAGAENTVQFNVGGALTDGQYSTDLYALITSGDLTGPPPAALNQLAQGVDNVMFYIANVNNGTFNPVGILAANANVDPGWHGSFYWGNDVGGAVTNNELQLGGNVSQLTAWRINLDTALVDRSDLGFLTSDASTGDISWNPVPVPAAAWLLLPAAAFTAPWFKRRRAQSA